MGKGANNQFCLCAYAGARNPFIINEICHTSKDVQLNFSNSFVMSYRLRNKLSFAFPSLVRNRCCVLRLPCGCPQCCRAWEWPASQLIARELGWECGQSISWQQASNNYRFQAFSTHFQWKLTGVSWLVMITAACLIR